MKSFSNNALPEQLYTAADCRDIDRRVINSAEISSFELMTRAGQFAFDCLKEKFPTAKQLIILCGRGNNGGDGYVIAGLAKQSDFKVRVYVLGQPNTADATKAMEFAKNQNCDIVDCTDKPDLSEQLQSADLIIDALLGTGVDRAITGYLAELVEWINNTQAPVLACDVPTGLNSDTGCVMNHCVEACVTTTFIALKAGMFTADAKQYCGEIKYADLGVKPWAYQDSEPVAKLINKNTLQKTIKPRSEAAHKGITGYAAVIGGAPGMMGAALMAGKAAYRTGAGRVKVITHPQHASQLALYCPELLTCEAQDNLKFEQYQALAIGPGLGHDDWARNLFNQVMQSNLPLVVDADALNLLAVEKQKRQNWILTPHPGEAARLLDCTAKDVQNNRFKAVQEIVTQYGGVCVLKGSGSLVATQNRIIRVCHAGNSGQATAGMGDVLTGSIIGLLVQGYELFTAACLGTWLHARAADIRAAEHGKIGMMATDLLEQIQIHHNQLHAD